MSAKARNLVIKMGKLMATYRVYPVEGQDVEKLASTLAKLEKVRGVQTEPIAFGLKIIKIAFMLDNATDNTDVVEEKLRKVKGVRDIETIEVTLIS